MSVERCTDHCACKPRWEGAYATALEERDALQAEVATLTRERDEWQGYYRSEVRARDEDRMQGDAARAEVQRLTAQVEQLRKDFDRANAWGGDMFVQLAASERDVQRLLGALEAGRLHLTTMHAGNWPTVLTETLAALRPPEADPSSTPDKKESPGAPQGENARTTCKTWCGTFNPNRGKYWQLDGDKREFCSEACMLAAPPGPSSGRPARELAREAIAASTFNFPQDRAFAIDNVAAAEPMKTAREVAHAIFIGPHNWCTYSSYDPAFKRHSTECDRTTAALEAVEFQLDEARAGRDAWIERATTAELALSARAPREPGRDQTLEEAARACESLPVVGIATAPYLAALRAASERIRALKSRPQESLGVEAGTPSSGHANPEPSRCALCGLLRSAPRHRKPDMQAFHEFEDDDHPPDTIPSLPKESGVCASWCATRCWGEAGPGEHAVRNVDYWVERTGTILYCTEACRDYGRSLHPAGAK